MDKQNLHATAPQEKQDKIVNMFDEIAPSYDKANRVMSLGIDVSWRVSACKKAFEALGKENIECVLDVACGTGDMLWHWQNEANKAQKHIAHLLGIDPSSGMLEVAHQKLDSLLKQGRLRLEKGEAKALNVESQSVDILSIAYGLRNVVALEEALDEFVRVLKPGGVIVILEFMNNEKKGVFDSLMRFYTSKILPLVGGLVSKNYAAYKYLPDSIQHFVSSEKLAQKLLDRGVKSYFVKSYSANISTLYVGVKI